MGLGHNWGFLIQLEVNPLFQIPPNYSHSFGAGNLNFKGTLGYFPPIGPFIGVVTSTRDGFPKGS